MTNQLPLKFSGNVIRGAGRGRTLGFPTANLDTKKPVNLTLGIYAGWSWIDSETKPRQALIYWGKQPTFSGESTVCEVFLIDKTADLYDTQLSIELVNFIRPDQRFDTPQALIDQMQQDMTEARRLLGIPNPTGRQTDH